MIPGSPMLWLVIALAAALPTGYAVMKITGDRDAKASYEEGKRAGMNANAASTVDAANKTATAERQAEEETPINPDKADLIEICKHSKSCTDWSKYNATPPNPGAGATANRRTKLLQR